ncbi:3-oxoacyl-ACP synthase III family protein [Streptomyces syringium]|uniref:3-oxoacyl-ACP synthase III family protein n=1 Tax=Streptomyces syringium TaxID=76729 RepID=UPI0034571047
MYSRISAVAAHLPERVLSTGELEERIAKNSPGFDVPRGMIERLTGVASRHVRPDGWDASDLAVTASRKALADAGYDTAAVDLLIFSAMSMDVLEPATAHIVADKLGVHCPVFDVKNACNSFLNALEVGDSLIGTGAYRRVLVCCGESVTQFARTSVSSPREFVESVTGYTLSDAGAAVVLEASTEPGIVGFVFSALSSVWKAGVLPFPGSAGRCGNRPKFRLADMVKGFHELFRTDLARQVEQRLDGTLDEVSLFCVHLASARHISDFCATAGIPRSRMMTTIASHGNMAAATLPLQLDKALREGRLHRGDLAVLVGHASGISYGILGVRV